MVSATSIAAVLVGGFGAVLLYALLRANPPESCIGCGKEFEVNEEVHVVLRGLFPEAYCGKCWANGGAHGRLR